MSLEIFEEGYDYGILMQLANKIEGLEVQESCVLEYANLRALAWHLAFCEVTMLGLDMCYNEEDALEYASEIQEKVTELSAMVNSLDVKECCMKTYEDVCMSIEELQCFFEDSEVFVAEYGNTEIHIYPGRCEVGEEAILVNPSDTSSGVALEIVHIVSFDEENELEDSCPVEYDISADFETRKGTLRVYFRAVNRELFERLLYEDDDSNNHQILVFEVTEDIMCPSYVGGDSIDYCVENNLFYKAFSKGDLVYASYEVFMKTLKKIYDVSVELSEEKLIHMFESERFRHYVSLYGKSSLNDLYEHRVSDGISRQCCSTKKRLTSQSCLYDVIKEIGKCAYTSPDAEYIQFRYVMDGDMLFSDFINNEQNTND